MRFLNPLCICLKVMVIIAFSMMLGLSSVYAQDSLELAAPTAPAFTAQSLEERIAALETNSALSNDQKDQIRASLETAVERLTEATRQSERHTQYLSFIDNAALLKAELDVDIKAAQDALEAEVSPMEDMIGDDALFELEQELIAYESVLADTETHIPVSYTHLTLPTILLV